MRQTAPATSRFTLDLPLRSAAWMACAVLALSACAASDDASGNRGDSSSTRDTSSGAEPDGGEDASEADGDDTGTPELDTTPSLDVPIVDDTGAPDTGAVDTGGGGGTDTGGGTPFDCSSIPRAAGMGEACTAPTDCGLGARCVADGAGGNFCRQSCIPDTCVDVCGAQEGCAPLGDQNGNPLQEDLDGDGVEEAVGACFPGQGAFEVCGTAETGACMNGMACAAFEAGATFGNCVPACETEGSLCGTIEGHDSMCGVLQTTPAGGGAAEPACGITCTTNDDCPSTMECITIGGGAVCLEQP